PESMRRPRFLPVATLLCGLLVCHCGQDSVRAQDVPRPLPPLNASTATPLDAGVLSGIAGPPGQVMQASFQQNPAGAPDAQRGGASRQEQDAPGVPEYQPYDRWWARPLPSYVYQQSYYNTWGVGARPLADYAPPGYEQEREQQDAPGVPVFIPIM